MTPHYARQIVKAINRKVRRGDFFSGGKQYGVDYSTWTVCYPQMALTYQRAAEVLSGRNGRFMPPRF